MKYKIIATDLDGTLLNDNREISRENILSINNAIKQGIIVVPCTGRAVQGITKYEELKSLKMPAVAYNGGMVINLENMDIIYHCPLENFDAKFIIDKGIQLDTNICVWIDNKLYCNKINKYTLDYSKISGVQPIKFRSYKDIQSKVITKVLWYDTEDKISCYLNEMSKIVSKNVSCCTSKPWFLEFFNSATSKALALEKVAEIYNVSNNEIIAIGDELNDISMIEYAGLGIAMNNARSELKLIADYVTENDNNHNGFSQVINKFILA
ncbi:MAG: Cof-type HAD-IIB family hydrolase [Acutalibacteraceae bacterium]